VLARTWDVDHLVVPRSEGSLPGRVICIIVSWHGEGLIEGERLDYGELELLSMDVK